jgi:hypothetical protein
MLDSLHRFHSDRTGQHIIYLLNIDFRNTLRNPLDLYRGWLELCGFTIEELDIFERQLIQELRPVSCAGSSKERKKQICYFTNSADNCQGLVIAAEVH